MLTASKLPLGVAGKVFVVGKSALAYRDMYAEIFSTDTDGKVRFSATIASALTMCTANSGDTILVLPGHTESITAAAGIACSVAGVTIKGLGNGANRPTLTWTTATTATMTVTAANVTIENFILDMTGFDAVVSGIVVSATDFTLKNSLVINAGATNQATLCILTTSGASRMSILNNEFLGTTDAGTAAAIRIVGGNEQVIDGNRFYGAYTTTLGAIDNATTACLRTRVTNNFIQNATAASSVAMTFQATSTGVIANNRMQVLAGTAPIVGAAMSWSGGNYYAAVIATAGTLI